MSGILLAYSRTFNEKFEPVATNNKLKNLENSNLYKLPQNSVGGASYMFSTKVHKDLQTVSLAKVVSITKNHLSSYTDDQKKRIMPVFHRLVSIEQAKYSRGLRGKWSRFVSKVKNVFRGNGFKSTVTIAESFMRGKLTTQNEKDRIKNAFFNSMPAHGRTFIENIFQNIPIVEWKKGELHLEKSMKATAAFPKPLGKREVMIEKKTKLKMFDDKDKQVIRFTKGGINVKVPVAGFIKITQVKFDKQNVYLKALRKKLSYSKSDAATIFKNLVWK